MSLVVMPVLGLVTGLVSEIVSELIGEALPPLVSALPPVFDVLAVVIKVTLDAQPDQPGSVGAPAAAVDGRYFVSALHVQVLGTDESVPDLWAGSSSVGPPTVR